jgi:hypothetical protein
MTTFTVTLQDGTRTSYADVDDRYEINNQNAVLTVYSRGGRQRLSPSAWSSVDDAATGYEVPQPGT